MGRTTERSRALYAWSAIIAACALTVAVPAAAPAANFPDKPIKLIVPFGAGGPPDVAARIIGAYLSEHLGPVVVENHVGAGGTLAARAVATSPPDGYRARPHGGSLSISPQLYKKAGVDPVKDFTAVALVLSAPLVIGIQKLDPGVQRQGPDRLCQGQSRQTELWCGDRYAAASER